MAPNNFVSPVSGVSRSLIAPAFVAMQMMVSGCTTAFTPESCSNSTPQFSPKLIETDDFQRHADNGGETAPGIFISCVCYDKLRKPNCSAAPIKIDVGSEQRWDCPAGWVATCRLDKTIAEGATIFGANAYEAYGGTSRDNFQIGPFGGELGPNGEGIPPGPNQPQRILIGPTYEFKTN